MPPPPPLPPPTTNPPPPASIRKSSHHDLDSSIRLSPATSLASLPHRPNPALHSLYAATASGAGSVRSSGTSTPVAETFGAGSTLLSASDGRSVSPVTSIVAGSPEARQVILRGFVPNVAVLASEDLDSLLKKRGFKSGFIELVRPFGETVAGKVTVREGTGASRSWEDFGIRFFSLKDAVDTTTRPSMESRSSEANGSIGSNEGRITGGDISHVEEVVDRHLNFAELRPSTSIQKLESLNSPIDNAVAPDVRSISPFYTLYLRRMLSGIPLSAHETFSHPVACIIAISSRNPEPIDEFKRLYASTNAENRFPTWVNNEYLRYYVLVHDEDNDDISKSTALYEQMKRHFSLNCHLLRLRSAQCVSSDDESTRLPAVEWMSAGEELALIQQRETADDVEDPTPYLFESDATALRSFVRELVTQSIVPFMERMCAQWNETVASRRRGFSGRFMSVAKRWTPFGGSSTKTSNTGGNASTNYDAIQGIYDPSTPEAMMRKLADYAFMLRDFKLAQSTFDLLRSDFEHDSAWKYYAGANEMCLVSTLLNQTSRTRQDSIDRWLEAARHSYIHRCGLPYYALRTFLLASECLQYRGSLGVDEPATWAARSLEMGLPGPIGEALIMERVSEFFAQKRQAGSLAVGGRSRKRGFWSLVAAEQWIKLGKTVQAEICLDDAQAALAPSKEGQEQIPFISNQIQLLKDGIVNSRLEALGEAHVEMEESAIVEQVADFDRKPHRKSIALDNMPAGLSHGEAVPIVETSKDEGFE